MTNSNPDRVALKRKVLKMWEEKYTSTYISKHMGITRNAVIGMVNRAMRRGLVDPRKPPSSAPKRAKKAVDVAVETAVPSTTRVDFRDAHVKVHPNYVVPVNPDYFKRTTPVSSSGVPFIHLGRGMCKYPISGSRGGEYMFCGNPRTHKAYCARHFILCYRQY